MKIKQAKKILQIIPADRWRAVYSGSNGEFSAPLACFALVEENGLTYVEGMEAHGGCTVEFCDDIESFIGYEGPEHKAT
ncbi:MAG: hypothetical protein GX279_09985 [Clostridiaceae bacterium]|nr:hypothetical protein [Clostridiaceae bacterium]